MFRDDPLAQDYLAYVRGELQNRTPIKKIEPPEVFFLRREGRDFRDPTEASTLRAEGTDPRYKAIEKIYQVLLGFPRGGVKERKPE
jgi:hypothetical protein